MPQQVIPPAFIGQKYVQFRWSAQVRTAHSQPMRLSHKQVKELIVEAAAEGVAVQAFVDGQWYGPECN